MRMRPFQVAFDFFNNVEYKEETTLLVGRWPTHRMSHLPLRSGSSRNGSGEDTFLTHKEVAWHGFA